MADRLLATKSQRACDQCRRRKIRCDNIDFLEGDCTSCLQNKIHCTYQETGIPRNAPKWYIHELEERIRRLESLMEELHPGEHFPQLGDPIEIGCWMRPGQRRTRSGCEIPGLSSFTPAEPQRSGSEPPDAAPQFHPCYGEAQPYQIVQSALERKYPAQRRGELFRLLAISRRPYYWSPPPWESSIFETLVKSKFNFPPPYLMLTLINYYFEKTNIIHPLLHRPTIMNLYHSGQHERDASFGTILMLICAIGSRWSADPLVLDGGNQHSAGWKYFDQVQQRPIMLSQSHSIHCVQVYALCTIYLLGCTSLEVAWSIAGFGLRVALKLGLHSRKSQDIADRGAYEIRKRTFWVLVALDRSLSSCLARPCALHDEEIDVDLPLEVDDDYWFHEGKDWFQQPPSMPSTIAHFNALLGLFRLQLDFMRRMNMDGYTHRYSGQPSSWKSIIDNHDAALFLWHSNLPPHLRWNPSQPNPVFANQTAVLLATYYQCFIGAHRASLHVPASLTVSVQAAQACTRLLDVTFSRFPDHGGPGTVLAAMASGLILQLGAWSVQGEHRRRALQDDINCCFRVLTHMEKRWLKAGRHADLLRGMMAIDHGGANSLPHVKTEVDPVQNIFDQQAHFPTLIQHDDSRYLQPEPYQFSPYVDSVTQQELSYPQGIDTTPPFDIWTPPENENQMGAWQHYLTNSGL